MKLGGEFTSSGTRSAEIQTSSQKLGTHRAFDIDPSSENHTKYKSTMHRSAVRLASHAILDLPIASTSRIPYIASRRLSRAIISRRSLPIRRWASTIPERRSFAVATKDHVAHLRSLLGSPTSLMSTLDGSASTDDLQPFNDDWMNKYHGKSQIVIKPKTTKEVSEILKYCNEVGLAVVPQGGNTGLVGECRKDGIMNGGWIHLML